MFLLPFAPFLLLLQVQACGVETGIGGLEFRGRQCSGHRRNPELTAPPTHTEPQIRRRGRPVHTIDRPQAEPSELPVPYFRHTCRPQPPISRSTPAANPRCHGVFFPLPRRAATMTRGTQNGDRPNKPRHTRLGETDYLAHRHHHHRQPQTMPTRGSNRLGTAPVTTWPSRTTGSPRRPPP